MKILDMDQGSPEWLVARSGIPTASNFDKIITSRGERSKQGEKYILELCAEWLTGGPIDGWTGNQWTERGRVLEYEAACLYEFERTVDTETVGFVLRDDGLVGCSPDRLVGDDGLLEIKCPAGWTHIEYLLSSELPTAYKQQVQGQLYICERQWCDFVSYLPGAPALIVRVDRDEQFIRRLQQELGSFISAMQKRREELTSLGYSPRATSE